MADTKRNNVAGKIATPKTAAAPATPAAQPMADTLDVLGKSIGASVKLTAALPQSTTLEGSLFTACPILNVVILNTRASSTTSVVNSTSQPGDYRIIPFSRIQSFQVISAVENGDASFATAQPPIGPIDIARLRQREQAKINKLKEEDSNRGKGVTKEAQAIFDSFRRINMPIRWHDQQMIVHEAIIIAPPYNVENCKGAKDKQEVLNRVRKVLEGERRKIREKEDRERKAATPVGPRKGG